MLTKLSLDDCVIEFAAATQLSNNTNVLIVFEVVHKLNNIGMVLQHLQVFDLCDDILS